MGVHHGVGLYRNIPQRFKVDPWWVKEAGHNDIVEVTGIRYYQVSECAGGWWGGRCASGCVHCVQRLPPQCRSLAHLPFRSLSLLIVARLFRWYVHVLLCTGTGYFVRTCIGIITCNCQVLQGFVDSLRHGGDFVVIDIAGSRLAQPEQQQQQQQQQQRRHQQQQHQGAAGDGGGGGGAGHGSELGGLADGKGVAMPGVLHHGSSSSGSGGIGANSSGTTNVGTTGGSVGGAAGAGRVSPESMTRSLI